MLKQTKKQWKTWVSSFNLKISYLNTCNNKCKTHKSIKFLKWMLSMVSIFSHPVKDKKVPHQIKTGKSFLAVISVGTISRNCLILKKMIEIRSYWNQNSNRSLKLLALIGNIMTPICRLLWVNLKSNSNI